MKKAFFVTILKLLLSFSSDFSDEIVTAAQHLYEMVSFYFDDLGKLLFVDVFLFWFNFYRVGVSSLFA